MLRRAAAEVDCADISQICVQAWEIRGKVMIPNNHRGLRQIPHEARNYRETLMEDELNRISDGFFR